MKAMSASLPFICLLSGFAAMAGLISMREKPAQVERQEKQVLVDVASVEACEDGFSIRVDGEVTPYREINLAAQVGGRISQKSDTAFAGNYVREGDQLFEIDRRDYELEVRRLQESVKQAGSSVEELDVEETNVQELVSLAEQQLALQRSELERFDGLRQKNAASASQYERARQSELQSLNSLQTLKNQLSLMKTRRSRLLQEKQRAITSLDLAALNLDRTRIASPINGVVIQDFAEQDDFVQAGTRLIQLEDRSKVEVRFSLRLDQIRWLWNSADTAAISADPSLVASGYTYDLPNTPIEVSVAGDGNHFKWPARLARYDGAGIDPQTRTVPVIAVVDDPSAVSIQKDQKALPLGTPPTLLRGSFVTVTLPVGKGMSLVTIPANAYRPDSTVWICRNETLEIEPVKLAYSDDQVAVILVDESSIGPGDKVITSPLPVAQDGMKVRVSGT